MSDLQSAQSDARDFHEWVTSSTGGAVPRDQAQLISVDLPAKVNRRTAEPTRQRIIEALEDCKEAVRTQLATHPENWPHTRLYFFGAGHGIAPAPRDAALLTANASPTHLHEHISCGSLLDYFSRVQHFKQLIIFADCCRTEERFVVPIPPPWTEDSINRGNVRKFFAAGARFFQRSFERIDGTPDEQRGYFTRALLDGLRGGAIDPDEPSAPVKASMLKDFITEHMRRNSKERFPLVPLEPDFVDEGVGDVHFGPIQPQPLLTQYPVRITVADIEVTNLAISDAQPGTSPVSARAVNGDRVFECDLSPGVWEAVPLIGSPPVASPRNWFFKVKEGANEYAF